MDDSLIVQFDSVGHRSLNVSNLTQQPFRVRMLWAEVAHKHCVSHLKTSHLGVIIMAVFLRHLMLSDSLGQVRSHNV